MKKLILILLFVVLLSCTFNSKITLTCTIPEIHPYEEASGKNLWYKIIYFDGECIRAMILDEGVKSFSIKVKAGGFRAVVATPLDRLNPVGAYYEDGLSKKLKLTEGYGSLMKLLVEASEYRMKAVNDLSLKNLDLDADEIAVLDQSEFLKALFDGELKKNSIKLAPKFTVSLENVTNGYWLSDSVKVESFYQSASDDISLSVFAGVYNFWNREKNLLMTLVVSEEGEYYTRISKLNELI